MAHACPICDQRCFCGGDIDDCELEGSEEQMRCTHCDDVDQLDDDDLDQDGWFDVGEDSGLNPEEL